MNFNWKQNLKDASNGELPDYCANLFIHTTLRFGRLWKIQMLILSQILFISLSLVTSLCVREIRLLCIFLEAGANLIPGAEGLDCLLLSVTGRVSVRNTIFIYSVFLREGGGAWGRGEARTLFPLSGGSGGWRSSSF